MHKVVIKILQTVLDGLATYPLVANFLQRIRAKNYENWLRIDKVIAMKAVCIFGPLRSCTATSCLNLPVWSGLRRISIDHAHWQIQTASTEKVGVVRSWFMVSLILQLADVECRLMVAALCSG